MPGRMVRAEKRSGAARSPERRRRAKNGQALEAAFLRSATSGDREGLAESLSSAVPELERIARHYALAGEEADDFVQATILAAIENAASFDPDRRLMPWLVGILLKKIARSRRHELARPARTASNDVLDEERGRLCTPLEGTESVEVRRLVAEAVAALPARYREVISMHLGRGLGGREIATELRRPEGTIRSQLHRGLRLLRSSLPPSLTLGLLVMLRGHLRRSREPRGQRALPAGGRAILLAGLATGTLGLLAGLRGGSSGPRGLALPELRAGAVAERTVAGVGRLEGDSTEPRRDPDPFSPVRETATLEPPEEVVLRAREHETGRELSGVEVTLTAVLEDGVHELVRGRTDDDGRWRTGLELGRVERLEAEARLPGYADMAAKWEDRQGPFGDGRELELPLERTRPIGGVVVDGAGRPVAGADVYLGTWCLADGRAWHPGPKEHVTRTDERGTWRHDAAPARPRGILLRVVHPEIATEGRYVRGVAEGAPELHDFTHRTVLEAKGVRLELLVTDLRGTPVPSAVVSLTASRDVPRGISRFPVDHGGRVTLRLPEMPRVLLTVRAPGFARAFRALPRGSLRDAWASAPLAIPLVPAETTRFTLVTADGAPIRRARVRPYGTSWREARVTDQEGRFELDCDPSRPFPVAVRPHGVLGLVYTSVDGRDPTRRLVVPAPTVVRGAVLEAGTGAAVAGHSVRVVGADGTALGARHSDEAGAFEVAFYPPGPRAAVEVSALGYESARSPLLATPTGTTGGAELAHDFHLAPVGVLHGQALESDGGPAAFARLRIEDGRALSADAEGRFATNMPDEDLAIAVRSPRGCAETSAFRLERTGSVRLVEERP